MLIVEDQFQEEAIVDNIAGEPFHLVSTKTKRERVCKDLRMTRKTEGCESHEEIQENKKTIHRLQGKSKMLIVGYL